MNLTKSFFQAGFIATRQVVVGRVVTLPVAVAVEDGGKVCNVPDHAMGLRGLRDWACEFEASVRIFSTMHHRFERDDKAQVSVYEYPRRPEEISLSGSGRQWGIDIEFHGQYRECGDQR